MNAMAEAVIACWKRAGPARWFARDEAFDAMLRERFLEAHFAAARGEDEEWLETADGALALVLLLDQVPRNLFRGSAHAFATDPLARRVAAHAIAEGFDAKVDPALRIFFYMPFEHSEAIADQDRAVALCEALGDANYIGYAHKHRDVIARFGRFPHRNVALGRASTEAEASWLAAGGGFG